MDVANQTQFFWNDSISLLAVAGRLLYNLRKRIDYRLISYEYRSRVGYVREGASMVLEWARLCCHNNLRRARPGIGNPVEFAAPVV
jgi:hypothetical protein